MFYGLLSLYFVVVIAIFFVNPIVGLIILLITSFILKQYFPKFKGYVGERRIHQTLEKLGPDYTIYRDVYVPKQDAKTTQIDHIVVSPHGIFVIEMKNYTGWIFGEERQQKWTQTIYKKKSRFYNPILQNEGHIRALKHYLQTNLDTHSIIVFSNEATFKFKEGFQTATVIHEKKLLSVIQQYTSKQMVSPELSVIVSQLDALVIKDKKQKRAIRKYHLAQLQTYDAEKTTETCPKCGAPLQKKKGKYGTFFGCSSFPHCRYTAKISR